MFCQVRDELRDIDGEVGGVRRGAGGAGRLPAHGRQGHRHSAQAAG